MLSEASFSKEITTISSLEQFTKLLNDALKNGIKLQFDIPFMTRKDYNKLIDNGISPGAWRYTPGFKYDDYYKQHSVGTLIRIDSKKYAIIDPNNMNLVVDQRLTIQDLYDGLVRSPEDFRMLIDGKFIDFGEEKKSLNKEVDNISSLQSFQKFIKKALKNHSNLVFDMPFVKKEYNEDLNAMDYYSKIQNSMDPKFRDQYGEIGTGKLKNIFQNKYVYIQPDDNNLVGDMRLTFSDLYDNLSKDPEDFKMYLDGEEVWFRDDYLEEFEVIKGLPNLTEKLTNSTDIDTYIKDFEKSDNNKFSGKSKDERRQMAIAAYYSNKGDNMKNIREDMGDNQSPIDVARRMGYDAARTGDRDRYDSSLRSLMNDHPGDKQREDIHKAYISGMDDFKSKNINEDNVDLTSALRAVKARVENIVQKSVQDKEIDPALKAKAITYLETIRDMYMDHGQEENWRNYGDGVMRNLRINSDELSEGKVITEKDLGKPGKNFDKIAKKAAKEYGSKEAGDKVAGAVLSKLRKEHPRKYSESINEDEMGDNQSPIDIARRMGYHAAENGDRSKFDSSLRSLMNDHPGDKQREDIHKAFISGMDDFKEGRKLHEADSKIKKKFVIELTFPYDGDSDLADAVETEVGKKAELNEVLRTRRIMEFDFQNASMFEAAKKTIVELMRSKGKTGYRLDSREEEGSNTPEKEVLSDDSKELTESFNLYVKNDRSPIMVSLPLIVESLAWASNNNSSNEEILSYAISLVEAYNSTGSCLDV